MEHIASTGDIISSFVAMPTIQRAIPLQIFPAVLPDPSHQLPSKTWQMRSIFGLSIALLVGQSDCSVEEAAEKLSSGDLRKEEKTLKKNFQQVKEKKNNATAALAEELKKYSETEDKWFEVANPIAEDLNDKITAREKELRGWIELKNQGTYLLSGGMKELDGLLESWTAE